MNINIYAVYDLTAKVFSTPFSSHNDETAIRLIGNMVNSQGHNYNLNPDHYTLHNIATFDDDSGFMQVDEDKTKVVDLTTLVKELTLPMDTQEQLIQAVQSMINQVNTNTHQSLNAIRKDQIDFFKTLAVKQLEEEKS